MNTSIRLFKIAGIDVGIHPTWFIAFVLIAWTFATSLLPGQSPGWTTAQYWVAGAAAAILLFVSVLIHELAHSFTARLLGLSVSGITLFLFGGVSRIAGEIRRARSEFLIAFSGPASSIAIGGLCLLAFNQVDDGTRPVPLALGILSTLGYTNLFLGAFNLLPGNPLDGGRVLRSLVWGFTGNARLASTVASASGKIVAFGLMAIGLVWMIRGDSFGGIWIIFLGLFLLSSATREDGGRARVARGDIPVTAALLPTPKAAEFGDTLESLAREYFLPGTYSAVPVARDGELIGFIESWDARRFDQVDWPNITVGPLAERRGFVIAAHLDSAVTLLRKLSSGDQRVAAVFSGPNYMGIVTADSLSAALARSQLSA